MPDCIFCKIIAGTIPGTCIYTSEHVVAFRDIHPKAPVHVLIVPKRHIPTLNDLTAADGPIVLAMMQAIQDIARSEGIASHGYRLIANTNADGGQEVFHLHFHLLGGKPIGLMVTT